MNFGGASTKIYGGFERKTAFVIQNFIIWGLVLGHREWVQIFVEIIVGAQTSPPFVYKNVLLYLSG